MEKKTIFLADDSITIQKVVELTFSEVDHDIVCAGSGSQALRQLTEVDADIALIDVHMPDRNGYEVCAQLKRNPDLAWMPVLLLTGTFEHFDEKRAREAGADGHMTKPFESRALLARVEELLAAHPRPHGRTREPQRASVPESTPPSPEPAAPQSALTETGASPEPTSSSPITDRTVPVASTKPETGGNGSSSTVKVPQEMLESAVREAVAGISEVVIREVAWQVIPDLAEAIIRKRIQELEEEAMGSS